MKTIRTIKLKKQNPEWEFLKSDKNEDVSEAIFEKIFKKFPQYNKSKHYTNLLSLEGDPLDQELINFLDYVKSLGVKLPKDITDKPFQVRISDLLFFEKEDSKDSLYMTCDIFKPLVYIQDSSEQEIGFQIQIGSIKRIKKSYASLALPHLIGVRGELKERLESSKLRGLKLIKLSTTHENGSWPDNIEPFYLLWSDLTLPPVKTELMNQKSEKRSVDYMLNNPNEGYFLFDHFITNPQLRYSADQILEQQFDIACTIERFTEGKPYRNRLIYSQKVIKILNEFKVPIKLKPVILEE